MGTMEDEDDRRSLDASAIFSARLRKFEYMDPTNKEPMTETDNDTLPLQTMTAKKRKRDARSEKGTGPSSPLPSKRRTTTKERSVNDPYEPENKLFDSLRPGLMLVFCGLNPGLETARTGHAYAHATNHFWPLLHNSGITPIRHKACDTHALPDLYQIGNTNLCERATRAGDGLSKQEQIDGAKIVEEKIVQHKPEAVCIVGKGIWDVIYKSKTGKTLKRQDFQYGWQDERFWLGRSVAANGDLIWEGARTFVCTSTSGLAADTKPAEKLAIMSKLGNWVKQRRREQENMKSRETSAEAQ